MMTKGIAMKISYVFSFTQLIAIALSALFLTGCVSTQSQDPEGQDPRSTSQKWQDSTIEFEAASWNNKAPFKGNVKVTAIAYDGKVVLFGQSNTEDLSQQLEQKIGEISNVKRVHNQIRIKPPLALPQQSKDSWITAKVKTAFADEPLLKGNNIKVITEDGEVFLLGYVSSTKADLATNIARNVQDVKQVIRAFNLTK
jgi:osmotically-inducible protein OsmY